MTHNRMDTIQNFYGRAIRDNKGNANEMQRQRMLFLNIIVVRWKNQSIMTAPLVPHPGAASSVIVQMAPTAISPLRTPCLMLW